MAHPSKKIKKSHLFIIVSAIIVSVGLIAFIVASGVANGWESVARWFGSSDAILLYVMVGLYGCLIAWLLIKEKIKRL